MNKKRNVYLQK